MAEDFLMWTRRDTNYSAYPSDGISFPNYCFPKIDFGQYYGTPGTDEMKYMHPAANVLWILKRIERKYGITIEGKERFAPYYVLLTNTYANADSWKYEAFESQVIKDTDAVLKMEDNDPTDPREVWKGKERAFSTLGSDAVTVVPRLYTSSNARMTVYKIDKSSQIRLETVWNAQLEGGAYQIKGEKVIENLGDADALKFTLSGTLTAGESSTLEIRPHFEKIQFPSKYPIVRNLPDMKQNDFLKALMAVEGLFAYKKDDKTIAFISVDDLMAKKDVEGQFLDWTDKLIHNSANFGEPDEIDFKFSNFAQRNLCMWAEDSTVSSRFEGVIECQNKNIPLERKAIELPFAGTDLWSDYAKINMYNRDGSANSVKPRLLQAKDRNGQLALSPKMLDFPYILISKYSSYQAVVRRPRVLKVKCLLNSIDISTLDMQKPVYFRQFGRYYAPIKIQTKSSGICDCEMLQL